MEPPDDLSDTESSASAPVALSIATRRATKSHPHLMQPDDYIHTLNPAQKQAVTASVEGGLQINAAPGSGKTKILTCRAAYLIQRQGIEPERLVVVTFTNKAANEMKSRLSKILGPKETERLVMGTFHRHVHQAPSVCVRYLRKYGKLVNLESGFTIADRDDCLAMIKRILPNLEPPDGAREDIKRDMKPPTYLDHISKCKARMTTPNGLRAEPRPEWDSAKWEWIARVYEAYEDELSRTNSLDFDDLLLKGHELFKYHPRVVAGIQSVLIDEFQDTNVVQYDLVKLISRASGSLTIVGDPDQSIYGWRNAEMENLERMVQDFKPCRQIFLEQNYRSTGAILGAALAVVRQDTKRVNKSLVASHPSGTSVVLNAVADAQSEATYIASTIRHLVAHLGGLVTYKDFAILLRYGALSRAIEVGLQRASIPSKMVGGHKFFERAEVKDMLSYLQLLSNPSYNPALQRILNVPKRSLGDKAQTSIFDNARANGLSAFELLVRIANGSAKGLVSVSAAQKKQIKLLVEIIRDGRKKANEGTSVTELLEFLTDRLAYRAYLDKNSTSDAADRWENVQELKTYAALVQEENPAEIDLDTERELEEVKIEGSGNSNMVEREEEDPDWHDARSPTKEKIEVTLSAQISETGKTTPLDIFLSTSMLATDTETKSSKQDDSDDKVTISTCHAAKGLEFPIVFIPACEDGTYPFYRATEPKEIDEERRLLYVAITRAQCFCFLTHANTRMFGGGRGQAKALTPFLSSVTEAYRSLFVPKLQKVTKKTREEMAKVLGRPAPSEEEAQKRIEVLKTEPGSGESDSDLSSGPKSSGSSFGVAGRLNGSNYSKLGRWSSSQGSSSQPQAVPAGAGGFQSARGMLGQNNFGVFGKKPVPATSASSRPAPTAFRPHRPSAPPTETKPAVHPPKYLAPRDQPNGTPSLAPYSKAQSNGPPPTVETRASMIRDAVLVNPTLSAPTSNPSTSRDLLSSFQSAESKRLDEIKELGNQKQDSPATPSPDTETELPAPADPLPPTSPPAASGSSAKRPPESPGVRRSKRARKPKNYEEDYTE
ncbi:uncharacterized protein JCM15063_006424 [Sporobolomyces koalae]|uniref:uncharacterized protein n=1 Tax=Sporobolomyces koalae TaxID=500713 RepID=UPI00317CF62A